MGKKFLHVGFLFHILTFCSIMGHKSCSIVRSFCKGQSSIQNILLNFRVNKCEVLSVNVLAFYKCIQGV